MYNLRGYRVAYTSMFYGSIWLQRSTKNSIQIGSHGDFGERVKIRCFGKGKIALGNNVSIGEFSIIHAGESVEIGDNVVTGAFCYINDTNHNFSDRHKPIKEQGWTAKKIVIQDNVWIGANVTILDGVTIGNDAVVGAGSVVTKDVRPFTIVAGIPAKLLSERK
jgi:acetyltransferase-like isoleucine patch superfamily enzyme